MGVVLLAMIVGQFVGTIVDGLTTYHGTWTGREWVLAVVLAGFVLSSGAFVVSQWDGVRRFFRTMHVGVTLVSLSLFAVFAGVLVPQIENFEDSTERIPSISDVSDEVFYAYALLPNERDRTLPDEQRSQAAARAADITRGLTDDQKERLHGYREAYRAFRWAEGYFVYHLIHPYGIGMPKFAGLPQQVTDGLDRFEKKYGREERDNREKQMKAAFNGREISTAIGTMIRNHESKFRAAFDVATTLHLNRAYKSHWFAALLGMLFVGIAFNTFKSTAAAWLSMRKVGYVTVHLGVMTLLIGGAISKARTVRGILHMDLREGPKDEFWAYMDPTKLRGMPFSLKLERFGRRDWKTLEVGFPGEQFKSQLPQYTLWPGRKVDLDFAPDARGVDRPRIRLEVVAVHERAAVAPAELIEGAQDEKSAIGPVAILTSTPSAADGTPRSPAESPKYLLAPDRSDRRLMYDPAGRFRISSNFGEDTAAAKKILADVVDGRVGWLSMRVAAAGGVEPQNTPVKIGDTVQGPGGYTIKVLRATPSFRFDAKTEREVVDPRPITEIYPNNPAVILSIQPSDGGPAEERPILERLDYENPELQKGLRLSELVVNFTWDPWNAPGPERSVLQWNSSGKATLVSADGNETPVALGALLPLPGESKVVLSQLFTSAKIDRRITLDPTAPIIAGPHFDSAFYSTDPTGVEVRVTTDPDTDRAHSEMVTLASTDTSFANFWTAPDKRFYLHYFLNDKAQPFEWRSVLSVWKPGADGKPVMQDAGLEEDREIRVNDYFHYAGYRFFQTNAIPELPTYSGIGVVYDPGIPIVLFGMYLTILGTVLAFIVRPIVEGYGKRARTAAPGTI
ncbi:MAG: hypothetical protein SGI72_01820 [Planctomycetota bacterium]|nr:hypothetical protein [Planctomycetota bacterium]